MKPSEYLWMLKSNDPPTHEFAKAAIINRWPTKEDFEKALAEERNPQ